VKEEEVDGSAPATSEAAKDGNGGGGGEGTTEEEKKGESVVGEVVGETERSNSVSPEAGDSGKPGSRKVRNSRDLK